MGPSNAAVDAMAKHLLEEDYRNYAWPTHADDDGYRGNGYVTIVPTDVQCHLRDKARRVLTRAAQIAADPRFAAASTRPAGAAGAEPAGEKQTKEEILDTLEMILPMAKGYAAAHPVGANQAKCDHADALLDASRCEPKGER